MVSDSPRRDPLAPINEAPEHVRRIIQEVLKLERDRLYQQRPHIIDDITRMVKDAVGEDSTL